MSSVLYQTAASGYSAVHSTSSSAAVPPRDISEPKDSVAAKQSLRILQWNVDDIKTKLYQLEMRIWQLGIDVVIIQESKLKKAD